MTPAPQRSLNSHESAVLTELTDATTAAKHAALEARRVAIEAHRAAEERRAALDYMPARAALEHWAEATDVAAVRPQTTQFVRDAAGAIPSPPFLEEQQPSPPTFYTPGSVVARV